MRTRRAALIVIMVNNFLMTLGFGLWQATFNNFAVEELGIRADQIGLIQSIREIPGLMGFLVGMLALIMAEMHIAGMSAVLMGVGIFITAFAGDLWTLIAATVLMSVGFHFFYASNSSALLLTVKHDEAPRYLGRMGSLGSLASVVSTLFILVALNALGYRNLFRVAGLAVVVGSAVLLPFAHQPVRTHRQRRRTPIRRRYWIYYALQFLMGSRRHIVTTFAVFLLVKTYRVTAQTITVMFLLNSLLGTYLNQAFGQIVGRFGERRVLVVSLSILTLIFIGYALIPTVDALSRPTFNVPGIGVGGWMLFPAFPATPGLVILLATFILDRILMGSSIALSSYLQKIAVNPSEITPNVGLGQTINHIAAVIVPVTGGIIWEMLGSRYTFLAGAGIVVMALGLALYMRVPATATSRTGEEQVCRGQPEPAPCYKG